ncbi:lipolytic enzyme, G-D-S-L [Lentibacillus cibarius]|uniref:Lipolytic enzyme, G-D-S-L n=1 Tax=Lentibacillus cibarius TaxID=2583219 RepID=A0A549YFJ7_9BACI|nr:SGNH/GDSL hydrolase family protein [Lentibacillus cibarius]TRM10617.1 lipolytic enzyme, G-D-S-L [Lentibacillus cibarius]
MKKRIVCFGDSNTWGYDAATQERFSEDIRWPCLLQQRLGNDYQVVEEGLSGRTSVCDDPLIEGLNGLAYIQPCLMSHAPLELVIIMLGTNDTKERFGLTAYNIAQGITRLAHKAKSTNAGRQGGAPNVLVVAPPPIGAAYATTDIKHPMGKDCDVKSSAFPRHLQTLLKGTGIHFLDAGSTVSMNNIDYMHLNQEGHQHMAEQVFAWCQAL